MVVLKGLQSVAKNGLQGVICSTVGENGRYSVKLPSEEFLSVKPSNLEKVQTNTSPAPQEANVLVWDFDPINDWSAEAISGALKPSAFKLDKDGNEHKEKAELNSSRSWKNTRLLLGYSTDSLYKDLGLYFDADDRTSPIHGVATKAFRCYGLDGNQFCMDWEAIRGSVVISRLEPPSFGGVRIDVPFRPVISRQELVDTMIFFKEKDAKDVALRRDSQRYLKFGSVPTNPGGGTLPTTYFGPAGVRDWGKVVGKDCESCDACGRTAAIAGGLKRCQCRMVAYCGKECQRAGWAAHKTQCTAQPAKGAGGGGGR